MADYLLLLPDSHPASKHIHSGNNSDSPAVSRLARATTRQVIVLVGLVVAIFAAASLLLLELSRLMFKPSRSVVDGARPLTEERLLFYQHVATPQATCWKRMLYVARRYLHDVFESQGLVSFAASLRHALGSPTAVLFTCPRVMCTMRWEANVLFCKSVLSPCAPCVGTPVFGVIHGSLRRGLDRRNVV